MATMDAGAYTNAAQPEQPADVAQANRLRGDLEMAEKAAEGFRKQQSVANEKADAAERVVEACRAALRVLDPPEKVGYNQPPSIEGAGQVARY